MKIRFHELKDKIEVFVVVCSDDVVQLDYVRVGQLVEVADLAVGALCVD